VNFLLVLIELFRYALRLSRYERKEIESRRFPPTRSVWSDISNRRSRPTNYFCTDSLASECLTTVSL